MTGETFHSVVARPLNALAPTQELAVGQSSSVLSMFESGVDDNLHGGSLHTSLKRISVKPCACRKEVREEDCPLKEQ